MLGTWPAGLKCCNSSIQRLASLWRTVAAGSECQALQSHVEAHLRSFSSAPVHHALHDAWEQNPPQSLGTDEAAYGHEAVRNISLAQLPPGFELSLRRYIASSGASAKEVRVMANQLRSKIAELEEHLLANAAPAAYNSSGPFASTPRTVSGRVTRQALYEASIALEHEGGQTIDPEVFNKLLGLPPPSSTSNRGKVKQGVHRSKRGARPKPPLEYNEQQALAAATASSSAWYATTLRVLHELRSADPNFRPVSMLDFGAGFGGATQAAQQVWPSGLRSVTAVERSPTMLHFNTTHMRQAAAANPAGTPAVAGADEEGSSPKHAHLGSSPSYSGIPSHPHSAQVRGASAAGPRVTWMRGLPRLPGKDGAAVVPPRHQLVVGAYVLSEETLLQERLCLIDQLWGHTADTLVLIEQGSRLGSSLILEARSRILDREARKVARQQNQQHQPQHDHHHIHHHDHRDNHHHDHHDNHHHDHRDNHHHDHRDIHHHDHRDNHHHDHRDNHHHEHHDNKQRGPGSRAVSSVVEREEGDPQGVVGGGAAALPVGAHVVAPCPHDGRCPLEGNPKVWCHFGQRYETPDFMRNTLGRGKDGISVRGAMDAHFSYVILRRGQRPKAATLSHPLPDQQPAQSAAQDQPISEEELWHEILSERMHAQRRLRLGVPEEQQGLEELEHHQAMGHDRDSILDGGHATASLSTRAGELGQQLARVEGGGDGPWAEGNPAAATEQAAPAPAAAAAAGGGASARPRRPLFADFDAGSLTDADAEQEFLEEQQQPGARHPPHQHVQGEQHVYRGSSSRYGTEGGGHADMVSSSSGSGGSSSDVDLSSKSADSSLDRGQTDEHPQGTLPGAHAEAFERKYPAHGRGLVDRLMALEDAGISWASDREGGLDVGAVEAAIARISQEELHAGDAGAHHPSNGGMAPEALMFAQDVADHASLSSQEGEGVAADPAEQHPGQAPAGSPLLYDALPDEVERAMQRLSQCKGGGIPQRRVGGVQGPDYSARAAAPWPRIYRKPLKRGSHVILDLCMPLEEHSAAQGKSSEEGSKQSGAVAGAQRVGAAGAPQGRLARQVITKANANRLLDREAYRLSKEVSWGDLWPSLYLIK